MAKWDDLYARFGEMERVRRERESLRLSRIASRRAFDAWSEQTTGVVMGEFAKAIAARSVEFERHTGVRVLLKYPAHPPVGAEEVSMRVMEMHLREARLHFYSFAESGRTRFSTSCRPRWGVSGGGGCDGTGP